MPWDGYLVGAGGHLHRGGIGIALRDDASGLRCKTAHYEHSHGTHDAPARSPAPGSA